MEQSFKGYGRMNTVDNDQITTGLLTVAGGVAGGPAGAQAGAAAGQANANANASSANQKTAGLNKFLQMYGDRGLPYFPSKTEMLRAANEAGWESHIKLALQFYDENKGTWNFPLDDWVGAVFSINPIRAMIFKGAGEQYEKDSNVVATDNANKALQNLKQQASLTNQLTNATAGNVALLLGQNPNTQTSLVSGSGSNTPNLSASVMGSGFEMSTTLWIVLAAIVIFTVVLLIKNSNK